jgi:hypothetical protein
LSILRLNRIEGDPDELLRLLLVEFSLLYSNDWYVVPVDLRPGAAYDIRSLVVTDVFGERTLVPAHHESEPPGPPLWRMFNLTPSKDLHLIPPVVAGSLHSDPVEEVHFLRDEVANLVWAVERLVPSVAGGVVDREALYRADPPPASPVEGGLDYLLATTVPEHWIPFQPVRVDPASADIRLRRAAALHERGGQPVLARPQGRVLEPRVPDLSLFEEEVPASGIEVIRHWQYARWLDGRTVLWLARRKGTGRLDRSSGLTYDHVEGG